MKTAFTLISFLLLISTSSFARIVHSKDKMFIEQDGNRVPMETVNNLIRENKISKIKLYGDGKAHVISFAKKGESEKLYSVDEKGFIYSLDPFTKYKVKDVHDDGRLSFEEVPGRKYKVSSKGFFLY
jgi:hypothetical protein